jgi:membrane-bound lytic murein transglycosylase MltF
MRRARFAALAFALLTLPPMTAALRDEPVHSDAWDDRYDQYFRKYSKRYFGPNFDWYWFKAQGIAESNLEPQAESHVGARGIMQILPSTYEEIREKNPHFEHINDPRWNIAAAIYYDRDLYRKWHKSVRRKDERLAFTFASYNAGYGTILKAQRVASKKGQPAKGWHQVAPHAPKQTQHYVRRIRQLMGR